MRFIYAILGLLLLSGCFGNKGLPVSVKQGELSTTISTTIVDHSEWDLLLKKHVNEAGDVNYQAFMSDRSVLEHYLKNLKENSPQESWPIEELFAYYINLYNAATIALLLDNDIPASIKDIGGLGGPWLLDVVEIGDVTMSLANLEKGILQKMGDPRIHYAINCASVSCPKLKNTAYTASNVETMMEQASFEFINSDKNSLDSSNPKLSSIFNWYKSDFTDTGVSLITYINQYAKTKINPDANIDYLDYNWNLNKQ